MMTDRKPALYALPARHHTFS